MSIEIELQKAVNIADKMTSKIVIDEDAITAKMIRESRREATNQKLSIDEAVDHLVCKICNLQAFELDSLHAKDYLKLIRVVTDFLEQ